MAPQHAAQGHWSRTPMDYDDIELAVRGIAYRDKLRLAQLLIQLARREDEQAQTVRAEQPPRSVATDAEYAAPRIRKLRPRKRESLLNSLDAMFQFRGGISDGRKNAIIAECGRRHGIAIGKDGRVAYTE